MYSIIQMEKKMATWLPPCSETAIHLSPIFEAQRSPVSHGAHSFLEIDTGEIQQQRLTILHRGHWGHGIC
jgi:hypothetical protein